MAKFAVTYEIVTAESAEQGDAEERGFIGENLSLREAVDAFTSTRSNKVGGIYAIEANEWPFVDPRWLSIYNSEEFDTGASETRSLHFPENVTPASKRRIARLIAPDWFANI